MENILSAQRFTFTLCTDFHNHLDNVLVFTFFSQMKILTSKLSTLPKDTQLLYSVQIALTSISVTIFWSVILMFCDILECNNMKWKFIKTLWMRFQLSQILINLSSLQNLDIHFQMDVGKVLAKLFFGVQKVDRTRMLFSRGIYIST